MTPEETAVAARRAVAAIEATLTELDAAGLRLPASTLRLQLGRDLDLRGVAAIVPLLAELGVDAAYLSPITQAAPGSTSGYDAIDHDAISAELGGDAGLAADRPQVSTSCQCGLCHGTPPAWLGTTSIRAVMPLAARASATAARPGSPPSSALIALWSIAS